MQFESPAWYEVLIGVGCLAVAAYGVLHITRAPPTTVHPWWEWAVYATFLVLGGLGVWPNRTTNLIQGVQRALPFLQDPEKE